MGRHVSMPCASLRSLLQAPGLFQDEVRGVDWFICRRHDLDRAVSLVQEGASGSAEVAHREAAVAAGQEQQLRLAGGSL